MQRESFLLIMFYGKNALDDIEIITEYNIQMIEWAVSNIDKLLTEQFTKNTIYKNIDNEINIKITIDIDNKIHIDIDPYYYIYCGSGHSDSQNKSSGDVYINIKKINNFLSLYYPSIYKYFIYDNFYINKTNTNEILDFFKDYYETDSNIIIPINIGIFLVKINNFINNEDNMIKIFNIFTDTENENFLMYLKNILPYIYQDNFNIILYPDIIDKLIHKELINIIN